MDDHEVVRVELQTVLSRQDSISVVGETSTVTDAIIESCHLQPDVALMDVRFPEGSGADACRAIRDSCPDTRVLFLSSYQDDETVLAAVVGVASGYLLKEVNAEELLRAIHAVAQGQSILAPAITQALLTRMRLQNEEASVLQRMALSTCRSRRRYCRASAFRNGSKPVPVCRAGHHRGQAGGGIIRTADHGVGIANYRADQ